MPRVLGILFRPHATWMEIRSAGVRWDRALFLYTGPLALLPSIAWPVGRAMQGAPEPLAVGFASTLLLSLVSVVLMGAAFYALAPFFGSLRSWDRSIVLACYASTPLFLCGALLLVPLFVIAGVGGLLYGIGLCAVGLPVMLECADSDVSAYLASAAVLQVVASMLLGGLCSAIGLI